MITTTIVKHTVNDITDLGVVTNIKYLISVELKE